MSRNDARSRRAIESLVRKAIVERMTCALACSSIPSVAAAEAHFGPLCRGMGRYIEIAFWPVAVLHFAYPSIATWLIEFRVNRRLRMLGSDSSYRRPLTVSVFVAAFLLILLTAVSVLTGAVICLVRPGTSPAELSLAYTLLLVAFTYTHVARVSRKEVARTLAEAGKGE